MDQITYFGGESSNEMEEIPWGKDWAKSTHDSNLEMSHEVLTCYAGDKGILLETGMFKLFVFKREAVYKFLLEALVIWSDDQKPVKPLIASYLNKKFHYGINESKPEVRWYKTDGKYYSRRVNDDPAGVRSTLLKNPFLAQSNDPATSKTDEPPKQNASKEKRLEAPRKAS